jgi:DNA-binding transcriptional LysR family regulator
MLDLNGFYYFVQVVDRGGFTAASRTLRIPKSTLSYRLQRLEGELGLRLLHRTSRRFGLTDAGTDFYQYAVAILRDAERAETAIRRRIKEPIGTVRVTAALATMQFAMQDIIADFLVSHPKVNIIAHATDRFVDIVAENIDVAIRGHSQPLHTPSLYQRTLAPAPWFLFAGTEYLQRSKPPERPQDLQQHPALFLMRSGVAPQWRITHAKKGRDEVIVPLTPRLLGDDIQGLKQAAIAGLGIVAMPGYICRNEVRCGVMRQVLPGWTAGDSTLTALMPYRRGRLPAVQAFIDYLVAEFPKVVKF